MNANAPQVNQPHGFDPSTLVGLEIANGDIRVVEHLNHGSFSFVYRGECNSTNSTYALKFMRKVEPTSREWRMQCMEFESHLRAHEHPGVVTLHRVIEHGDYIVLVLDYISGGDLLDAVLKQPSRYKGDEHRIRSTFGQMLRALKHTHDVGVVHRDLKLENFLVSEDLSEVYLADFGLATTSRVYEPVGSMPYVPPEYLREHVRPSPTMSYTACDVWAMGCLLYQLLTGVCPWKQASLSDPSYINYLRDRRTIFATYGHNLTRELQSLLIKALAPHPVDRSVAPTVHQDYTLLLTKPFDTASPSTSSLPDTTHCPHYTSRANPSTPNASGSPPLSS
ncbi:kinase-like protein [Peniophora sp. CONT]|nr:kinase-like protein [Peniophora sp. CONT]